MNLKHEICLNQVLYFPELSSNIISVLQLKDEKKTYLIHIEGCFMHNLLKKGNWNIVKDKMENYLQM